MMGKANAWRERYYKKLTYAVAEGSMCWDAFTSAVIVKDGAVVVACHNETAEGWPDCHEQMLCECKYQHKPTSQCPFIPAEKLALQQAEKLGISLQGATLYRCAGSNLLQGMAVDELRCLGFKRIVTLACHTGADNNEEDEDEAEGTLVLRFVFDDEMLHAYGLTADRIRQEAYAYFQQDVEARRAAGHSWPALNKYGMRKDGSFYMIGPDCLHLFRIVHFFDEHEDYGECVKSIPSVIDDEESDALDTHRNLEVKGL